MSLRHLFSIFFALTLLFNSGGNVTAAEQSKGAAEPIGNNFGFGFFSSVEQGKENTLLSPLSAFLALSMTFNGAAGATEKDMGKALGISELGKEALNKRNQLTLESFKDKPFVQIANAIFADDRAPIKPSFLTTNKTFYGAEVTNLPFSDAASVDKINGWCKEKTQGKIPTILKKLSPRNKLVLLNAIYFKGKWNHPFDKSATDDQQFHLLDAKTKNIKMMHQTKAFLYCKQKDFQAVVLPYEDSKLSMYVMLPDQGVDFQSFARSFHQDVFNAVVKDASSQSVKLSMPKFKVEYSIDCKDALTKMGMGSAFADNSDFSDLFSVPGGIDQVIQKTYMDVNEEGTEAAAVTAVTMFTRSAMRPVTPVDFVVDRPFVVAIRDNTTGELLFLGSVVDPG